ncbi:TipC family immunity protein [Streptococcus mitis]|uniref:TipC family immunity protein n=1 Tax=Streptococcus mitis TaxID=28037 RepID=A0A7X1RKY6_STRMT|nr:TipC family immunity protein [Streptococcus mitis]MQQ52142.1 TipC family immunity protein [Streptococcus mitis]
MNKKMFYSLSIGAFLIMLLPLAFIFLKPRYSNVFEEIYHDEYHHATTSFLRTNSTLNRIPEMEVNKTGGLLYGSISEKYRSEVLPTGVESISYSFYYPDGKLDSGRMSIDFLFMHSSGVIIDIYYKYNHESDKLVQSLNIIDEKRLTDLNQIMEYVKEKKINLSPYFTTSEELLRNKIIPDWLSVYPSQFSVENWGNVKMIRENETD